MTNASHEPSHPNPTSVFLGPNIFLRGLILQNFRQYRTLPLGKRPWQPCIPRSRECTAAKLCCFTAALGTGTYVWTFPQREMIIEGKGEMDGSWWEATVKFCREICSYVCGNSCLSLSGFSFNVTAQWLQLLLRNEGSPVWFWTRRYN
jgi:hypothetical protein